VRDKPCEGENLGDHHCCSFVCRESGVQGKLAKLETGKKVGGKVKEAGNGRKNKDLGMYHRNDARRGCTPARSHGGYNRQGIHLFPYCTTRFDDSHCTTFSTIEQSMWLHL
jgi:hypothetical protein